MTTTIIVKTVDWPVRVVTEEKTGQNFHSTGEKTVEPNSEETFHIHSTMALRFEELPMEQPEGDLTQKAKDMGLNAADSEEDFADEPEEYENLPKSGE